MTARTDWLPPCAEDLPSTYAETLEIFEVVDKVTLLAYFVFAASVVVFAPIAVFPTLTGVPQLSESRLLASHWYWAEVGVVWLKKFVESSEIRCQPCVS